MGIGRWAARLLAAVAALGLAGSAPQAAPAAARPALWKLADADTTIYLFGTFHLLPAGQAWRTPALDSALAASDELVLEVANLDDTAATMQAVIGLGVSPGLPPLAERVPPGKRAALAAMVAESGIPGAVLDRLETWAAALALASVTFKRLGLDPKLGVERQLTAPWTAAGKPVGGLETVAEQLGFFDHMSEAAQRIFLTALLDDPATARAQFAAMLGAWMRGDTAAIARTFNRDAEMSAELRDALLERRNAKWAEWLERRLARPGTVFVAVGAGHLAGPQSVQRLLRAKGLKATRVQ